MAKKKAKRKPGKGPRKASKQMRAKFRKGKKAGSKAKGTKTTRMLLLNPADDVWDVQKALRKDKYFAVAKGPSKILTNAPITRI